MALEYKGLGAFHEAPPNALPRPFWVDEGREDRGVLYIPHGEADNLLPVNRDPNARLLAQSLEDCLVGNSQLSHLRSREMVFCDARANIEDRGNVLLDCIANDDHHGTPG